MSSKEETQNASAQKTRTIVESKEGAVLRVERLELSEAAKRSLTTDAKSIGSASKNSGSESSQSGT
jgi:hypothetical protein